MKSKYCIFCLLSLLCAFFAAPAAAQKCTADYEVINYLRKPEIGSYNVWDTIYGERVPLEEFTSGLKAVEGGNVVVAGARRGYEEGDARVLLMEIDRRGRSVWEQTHVVEHLRNVKLILHDKSGYIVMGDQKSGKKNTRVWIGFFDAKGNFLRSKTVSDPKGDLYGHSLIRDMDGKGLVLAASMKGRGDDSRGRAVIYRLNSKGDVVSKRSYAPGLENAILSLTIQDGTYYIGAGYSRVEDGRKAGWVIKMNKDGNIIWQRQYPRGLLGSLNVAVDYTDKFIVVAGEAEPSDRKNRAGWVMMLDGDNGDIAWQRYYTGAHDFAAKDLIAHDDNQISVLLDAQNPGKEESPEYARILTLSPRGEILLSDSYYNAVRARGADLFLGQNSERIIAGYSDVAYIEEDPEDPGAEPKKVVSREGWVLAGAPAEPYNDPCFQSYSFIP